MKQKRAGHRIYGLRAKFRISLVSALFISVILFFVLFGTMDDAILKYNQKLEKEEVQISKQFQSLQDFIDENKISSSDLILIREWEAVRPVNLLEIYSDNECIYSSLEDNPEFSIQNHSSKKDINAAVIHLTDMDVEADLYMDFTYQYYFIGIVSAGVISAVVFIVLFMLSTHSLINYISQLNDEIHILEGGNLDCEITVKGNDELTDLAISMNNMRESFKEQMETEQRLHEASHQMVTEMSHDLRTPLTGIMLYTDILRLGKYQSEKELNNYLEKIDAKAQQMKELSDHLLEYNLDGMPEKKTELMSMEQAFGVIVQNFKDDLRLRGFDVVSEDEWVPCFVRVEDEYDKRIFDNIASNISKYADPEAKVYFEIESSDEYCGFTVINTCLESVIETESNGVGIESIRSMMKKMEGVCVIEQSESAFEISIMFPKR